MKSRRRSGVVDTADEAAKMSEAEFESEIERYKWALKMEGRLKAVKHFSKGWFSFGYNAKSHSISRRRLADFVHDSSRFYTSDPTSLGA
jgi:hypothetical protein